MTIGGVPCVIQPAQSRHNSLVCVTQLCFGPLTVTVAGQQRATTQYTYTALVRLAEIVEVTPLSGPTSGGTVMSIIGNAFGTSGNVTLQEVALGTFAALGAPVPCTVEYYSRAEIRSVGCAWFAAFAISRCPSLSDVLASWRPASCVLFPVSCACNYVAVTRMLLVRLIRSVFLSMYAGQPRCVVPPGEGLAYSITVTPSSNLVPVTFTRATWGYDPPSITLVSPEQLPSVSSPAHRTLSVCLVWLVGGNLTDGLGSRSHGAHAYDTFPLPPLVFVSQNKCSFLASCICFSR